MPTNQGTKVLYNTVTLVLPIIQQFFFLMALNGISNNFHIYGRLRGRNIGLIRLVISVVYTFLASLTVTGYIWAYREGWGVNGNQFVLIWMTFWLYMHINFGILDAATAFIPISFLSFFVLTWVILNITSTIYPFDLNPGFYRWAYALPAHEIYTVQLQIYGGGCNNRLHIALPILFSIWIVATVLAILGSIYRNKNAERELLALEEKERSLIEEGKRVGLETRDELQRAAADTFMAGFPMPFQNMVYTAPTDDSNHGLRRQGTV